MRRSNWLQELVSEGLATGLLVFLGCGSILVFESMVLASLWIGVSFGVAVALGIVLFGRFSGAHMNPAVTLALAQSGLFERRKVPAYLLAQVTGAVVAAIFLAWLFPFAGHLGETVPKAPLGEYRIGWTFLLEAGLTFGLMLMVLWCVRQGLGAAKSALLIGLVVAGEATFFGWLTGASMNPARSFGPAVVSGNIADLWVYLLAPTLGAGLAVGACRRVAGGDCCRGAGLMAAS